MSIEHAHAHCTLKAIKMDKMCEEPVYVADTAANAVLMMVVVMVMMMMMNMIDAVSVCECAFSNANSYDNTLIEFLTLVSVDCRHQRSGCNRDTNE